MLRLVIFDCDGVLFESHRANVAYYNAVMEQLGLGRLPADWERRAHVMAASQLFEVMFEADPALKARAREAGRSIDYAPFYPLMEPVPGMFAVLEELKPSYRLAMASNRGKSVAGVVEHFGLNRYFDLAVGVLDGARPKPHPDMIEKCVGHFGVAASDALYVGDAESDWLAASAAGVHFIAVGEHDWAPRWVRRLSEIPAAVRAAVRECGDQDSA